VDYAKRVPCACQLNRDQLQLPVRRQIRTMISSVTACPAMQCPTEIIYYYAMAEEATPGVRPESQISIKTGASPNQQEIERRREMVRQFFNDFWVSAEDKPGTFAERLNRAEGHINERLAEKPT